MAKRNEVVPPRPRPEPGRAWTRVEDYADPRTSWRRYVLRARRRVAPATEPTRPRFTLGTLPFMVLVGLLGILAFGIILSAIPGTTPHPRGEPAATGPGTTPPGWLTSAGVPSRR